MADIFLSYANQDRAIAKQVADKLTTQGYSVWWDTTLVPGANYRPAIMSELEAATRVFVIWTPASVKSEWVISEAERAARMNKLVTLRVADLDIHAVPPPFDQRHSVVVDDVAGALNASTATKIKAGPDLLRQGLMRAWKVLSGIWVGGCILFLLFATAISIFVKHEPVTGKDAVQVTIAIFGPPLGLFLLGAVYYVIYRGFRPR